MAARAVGGPPAPVPRPRSPAPDGPGVATADRRAMAETTTGDERRSGRGPFG